MSELSEEEFRAKARAYIDNHVASGGKRSDVLKDWLNSDDPQVKQYAQELSGDISPPTRAETGPGQGLQPPTQPLATTANKAVNTAQGIVEQYAPWAPPIALGAVGLYGLSQGAKALNTFREGRRAATLGELQAENLRLQNAQLRQGMGSAAPSTGPLPEPGMAISGGATTPAQLAAFNQLYEAGTGQAPAPAAAPAEPDRMARAATRIQEGQALGLGAQPAAPTAAPAAAPELPPSPRMVAVPNPNATSQWDQYLYVPENEASTAAKTIAPSATPEPEITGKAGAAIAPAQPSNEGGFKAFIQRAEQIKPAGSVPPSAQRRSAAERQVANEETPYNRGFNQFSEMAGKKAGRAEVLAAWDDVYTNVLKGEMPKGQGGKMYAADAIETYLRNNGDKYPNVVANLDRRAEKAAEKRAAIPPQAKSQQGFVLGQMPTELTPIGQGAANFGRQLTGDLKMGAAALPFMFATDVRQQNVGYERELRNEMAKTKDPARQAELQGELGKLEEQRYLKAMYDRFVKQSVPAPYRPALTR